MGRGFWSAWEWAYPTKYITGRQATRQGSLKGSVVWCKDCKLRWKREWGFQSCEKEACLRVVLHPKQLVSGLVIR